jgi:hypothetical protein
MALDQDVAAARSAAAQLAEAVQQLGRHYRDSVDLARLEADVDRIGPDLDLLAGPVPAAAEPQHLEVIPDTEYPPEFWADAADEGIGRP